MRGTVEARTDFFGDWECWYEPLWSLLCAEYDIEQIDATGPRFRVVEVIDDGDEREASAVVLENRELVRPLGPGSKRHLELRLPAGVRYRTGDYLSVLTENEPGLVDRMIARLHLRGDAVYTITSDAPHGSVPLDRPLRVEDLLTRYVDLAAPATPGVVTRLVRTATCPPERAQLERLADDAHAEGALRPEVTLLDLLVRFASCDIDPALALELLPAPRPRQYSISSAAEEQREAALTVSVLEGPARAGGGTFRGTASGYLQRVRPGDCVAATVTSPPETFRPPSDAGTPVVMIAAGSGIAPFRGFIRARMTAASAGEQIGATVLFFGCRHPDWDDLYATELGPYEQAARLTVHRAYSRLVTGEVRYVQDRLWERRDEVRALIGAGAHVYVCGDAMGMGMGAAVEETVQRIGARIAPDGDGSRWLNELRAAGRYVTDVF